MQKASTAHSGQMGTSGSIFSRIPREVSRLRCTVCIPDICDAASIPVPTITAANNAYGLSISESQVIDVRRFPANSILLSDHEAAQTTQFHTSF